MLQVFWSLWTAPLSSQAPDPAPRACKAHDAATIAPVARNKLHFLWPYRSSLTFNIYQRNMCLGKPRPGAWWEKWVWGLQDRASAWQPGPRTHTCTRTPPCMPGPPTCTPESGAGTSDHFSVFISGEEIEPPNSLRRMWELTGVGTHRWKNYPRPGPWGCRDHGKAEPSRG